MQIHNEINDLQFTTIEDCCEYFDIIDILNTENFKIAITHSSVKNKGNYETLEFLGDTILNFSVSKMLFDQYNSQQQESDMSKMKSFLVSAEVCSQVSYEIGLDKEIITYNVIQNDSSQKLPESITADCLESFIATIYLNYGETKVHQFINTMFGKYITEYNHDPKTYLQELAHKKYKTTPIYTLMKKEGSDHNPIFTISVKIGPFEDFGTGANKKLAEKNACVKIINKMLK